MEENRNQDNNKMNANIISLINRLLKSNDIGYYKNKIKKYMEDNYKFIFGTIKNDRKTYILLTRTFYLNEFDKIEKNINSDELIKTNNNLSNEKYIELLSYLYLLISFEDLYVYKKDILRSLLLQSKIINIIKNYFINKIS